MSTAPVAKQGARGKYGGRSSVRVSLVQQRSACGKSLDCRAKAGACKALKAEVTACRHSSRASLSTMCPSDCIPHFTQDQSPWRHARCFRASVHFNCAGERAAAATRARRYALHGTAGGVTATRPIATICCERMHTPARRRGGTIGWPLLCPAQHLGRPQT
jgi:hypothetical protein